MLNRSFKLSMSRANVSGCTLKSSPVFSLCEGSYQPVPQDRNLVAILGCSLSLPTHTEDSKSSSSYLCSSSLSPPLHANCFVQACFPAHLDLIFLGLLIFFSLVFYPPVNLPSQHLPYCWQRNPSKKNMIMIVMIVKMYLDVYQVPLKKGHSKC